MIGDGALGGINAQVDDGEGVAVDIGSVGEELSCSEGEGVVLIDGAEADVTCDGGSVVDGVNGEVCCSRNTQAVC